MTTSRSAAARTFLIDGNGLVRWQDIVISPSRCVVALGEAKRLLSVPVVEKQTTARSRRLRSREFFAVIWRLDGSVNEFAARSLARRV